MEYLIRSHKEKLFISFFYLYIIIKTILKNRIMKSKANNLLRRKISFISTILLVIIISLTLKINTNQEQRNEEPLNYPSLWMDYQRTYPHKTIKPESYKAAMKQAVKLHNAASRKDIMWELAGPTNVGGRITDLAIHTDDLSTIYIGGASGGIFKSTDSGDSWEQVFEDAATISIGDLAIDPNNPDIIYAGTGESNSSSYSFLGDGIYKSIDGGDTWDHIGLENSGYIGRIIVDYNNSDRVYVAACGYLFSHGGQRGIYRSLDGGETWDDILFVNDSTSGIDIVQHPEDPDILYATMWERRRGLNYRHSFGDGSGVWKTTDGGDNWTELTNGLPTGNDVGRIGVDISKSNPDVLYTFYDMPSQEVRVYRTENGGSDWTRTNDASLDEMNSSFGWYFGQIRVDPTDEDIVYVMGVELHRTTNGGSSYTVIADYNNTHEIHVDHHAMYIDENTGRIFEGNDGGFYYSDDLGDNWTKINNLSITQFYFIEVDYQNPAKMLGGTQDNGTVMTVTGNTDDWFRILGGDGFYCLVDYQDNNNVYAEYQYGGLYKSENGGYSFNYIGWEMYYDRTNWMAPLAIDPVEHETLYFGTYRIWKTTDGGDDWNTISGDLTKGGSGGFHTITTIAVSEVNNNIIVVGSADGRVHITENDGSTWNDISAGLPNRWITRVATDPLDENTIYATVSGFRWGEPLPHVYKSTDLGQNWIDISGNLPELPVNVIAIDPENTERIFVGTDAGVFYTEDGGQNWESLKGNIPNAPIVGMDLHNPTRTLIIGTYGISAYRFDLDQLVDVTESIASGNELNVKCYPNPFTYKTNISFEIDEPRFVKIDVYDLAGKQINSLLNRKLNSGSYNFQWNAHKNNLSYGSYIIKVRAGNETSVTKVIYSQ